jgi:Holliday junction DNA helicase RuvA
MFAYIKGTVEDVTDSLLVLEAGSIGYSILISSRDASNLPPRGSQVKVYTHMNVREDDISLFGFLEKDDLDMFRLLLTVSGIGPKAAIGILSVLTADDLRFAVLSDDAKTISRAPGVGSKTAKKLILELKDKLSLEDAFEKKLAHAGSETGVPSSAASDAKDEAVQALAALGYSSSDALRAVRKVEVTDEMDVETILKLALKQMI